jgi:serine/threonine protein kinase
VKHIGSPTDPVVFAREVKFLAQLNHRCVLRILGWTLPDGSQTAQIHTEYAANGSLNRLLADVKNGIIRPFWSATGLGIMICGIVLGMRYIHSRSIIHQDLKPANILLNGEGHPLIGDFGASRLEREDAAETSHCATAYYAAPEMFEEGGGPTLNSDVFSFGLLAYEMIVGSPVFPVSHGPLSVIGRLRARELPPIPLKCGPLMQDVIFRCWSMKPNDRPSFGEILAQFQVHDFAILPNADAGAIRDYFAAIREWERKAGIPQ